MAMRAAVCAAALQNSARFSHFAAVARRSRCQERKHGQRLFSREAGASVQEGKQEKQGMQYQAGCAGALLPSINLNGSGRRQRSVGKSQWRRKKGS